MIVRRRRCRHVWRPTLDGTRCERCSRLRSPEQHRIGRRSRRAGSAFEAEIAELAGLRAVGAAGGPDDLLGSDVVVQAKLTARFPGWIWAALPPASAGRMRAVIVGEPGPAKGRRILVCVPLDDFVRGRLERP